MTKEIFLHNFFFRYDHQKYKNLKPDRKPDPDHRENYMCSNISMTEEIFQHKIFFDMTIRSTKTGNRTENRTLDQPEIFMDFPALDFLQDQPIFINF